MTPEQAAAIVTLAKIMEYLSEWPFAALFFVVIIGPWVLAIFLAHAERKRFEQVTAEDEKRFEAAVRMYENNVELVKRSDRMAADLHDVVIMNTQVITELVQSIKTNQFCPMVRLDVRTRGVLDE